MAKASKSSLLIDTLKKNAEKGISVDELMKTFKTKSSIFSLINYIRKTNNIITKDSKYFWQGEKKDCGPKQKNDKPTQGSNTQLPFPLPKGSVPEDKKEQFIDMIGQAVFYYKCAEALISSEKLKQNLSN